MKRTNKWRVTVKSDVEGDEPQILVLKGTSNPRIAREHAMAIAGAQINRVRRDWGDEHAPTLTVDKIEALDEDTSEPGSFRPPGAKPIDLDRFTKKVSEKLGHGGERPVEGERAADKLKLPSTKPRTTP